MGIANQAGEKLKVLVPKIKKTNELVEGIANSSQEQKLSIEQVNSSVQEVNNVVQHNAGQAEKLTTASESFSSHAGELEEIVSQFKL